jgi:hypothetical protein
MNEDYINKVKQLLLNWNPLGDKSKQIADLDNYNTEAIDILWHIDKKSSIDRINKITAQVLSEAFGIYIDLNVSRKYAEKIQSIINDK